MSVLLNKQNNPITLRRRNMNAQVLRGLLRVGALSVGVGAGGWLLVAPSSQRAPHPVWCATCLPPQTVQLECTSRSDFYDSHMDHKNRAIWSREGGQ